MSTSALSFNQEASSLSASFVQLIKASNRERRKPRKIPLLYCLKPAASGKLTVVVGAQRAGLDRLVDYRKFSFELSGV